MKILHSRIGQQVLHLHVHSRTGQRVLHLHVVKILHSRVGQRVLHLHVHSRAGQHVMHDLYVKILHSRAGQRVLHDLHVVKILHSRVGQRVLHLHVKIVLHRQHAHNPLVHMIPYSTASMLITLPYSTASMFLTSGRRRTLQFRPRHRSVVPDRLQGLPRELLPFSHGRRRDFAVDLALALEKRTDGGASELRELLAAGEGTTAQDDETGIMMTLGSLIGIVGPPNGATRVVGEEIVAAFVQRGREHMMEDDREDDGGEEDATHHVGTVDVVEIGITMGESGIIVRERLRC